LNRCQDPRPRVGVVEHVVGASSHCLSLMLSRNSRVHCLPTVLEVGPPDALGFLREVDARTQVSGLFKHCFLMRAVVRLKGIQGFHSLGLLELYQAQLVVWGTTCHHWIGDRIIVIGVVGSRAGEGSLQLVDVI